MFVVPGSFVPYNDTVTLLTYKRLRNLDLDMDVFCFTAEIIRVAVAYRPGTQIFSATMNGIGFPGYISLSARRSLVFHRLSSSIMNQYRTAR